MKSCMTCRYMHRGKGITPHCRRFPPTAHPTGNGAIAPPVFVGMWCWEFKRSLWRTIRRWFKK